MARPTVDPMSLEFNQIPLRRESSRYVRLGEAPSDAQLTATVLLKGDVPPSLVRVKHVTASRLMPIPMEDYDRPPHAPPYPHVELTGVIVGQSDGTTPLGIEKNDTVMIEVVVEPANLSLDQLSGTVLINGTGWDPISLPLTLTFGEVESRIGSEPLTIQQGGVGTATITAWWVAGPDADVNYSMIEGYEGSYGVTMDPASLRVRRGEAKTVTLTLRAKVDAEVGPKFVRILQTVVGGSSNELESRLVLNITPAPSVPDAPPSEEDIARAKAAIDTFYHNHGGPKGPFGFPLREVEFHAGIPSRKYSGGKITILGDGPKGTEITTVRVRFVGFRSYSESGEWSASDEPYFIIGVAGANGSNTMRFGPYDDVDAGEIRVEATMVASDYHKISPPIVIGVVAMEHDEGTPEEAEAKVRKVVEEIERKFDQAVGGLSGAATGSHVMPEWARDILIGWVPEGIAAIFGLGDDEIGKTPIVLFDHKPDLDAWTRLPVIGRHGGNEYTTVIPVPVGGGGEGEYDLYFYVELWKTGTTVQ